MKEALAVCNMPKLWQYAGASLMELSFSLPLSYLICSLESSGMGWGDGKGGGIKCKIRLPRASFLLAGSLLPTSWALGRACSLRSLNIPSLVVGWVGKKWNFG